VGQDAYHRTTIDLGFCQNSCGQRTITHRHPSSPGRERLASITQDHVVVQEFADPAHSGCKVDRAEDIIEGEE
jgi:hypothetical protein